MKNINLIKTGGILMPAISNGFRLLQSSYAKGINKQMNRTGNLFQQKTKSKLVANKEHAMAAFHYIHQNPVTARLVKTAEEWNYSSFSDYAGFRNGTLCNKEKAYELLGLTVVDIRNEIKKEMTAELIETFF